MWLDWGRVGATDSEMFDGMVADWVISELESRHEKPFFLAYGTTKPHLPWYVPEEYFELHPLQGVVLPITTENDLDDVPPFGRRLANEVYDPSSGKDHAAKGGDHRNIVRNDQWRAAVQGYLAAVSFADAQVGRVLDALATSPYASNTLVVLWGDHGWHLGEKQHWRKHALWEVSTRTPLVISRPGQTGPGRLCDRPVSLVDLYPTLLELAGLPPKEGLDGQSIVPLLDDPERPWPRPVLMTFGYKNHAVRSERWRYIRYHDGTEELYDHQNDPGEWTNLAADIEHQSTIARLREALPKSDR